MRGFIRTTVFSVLVCATALTMSGCAGARLNKNSSKPLTPAERITQLEQEAQMKDQQIAQMEQELNSLRSTQDTSYSSGSYASSSGRKSTTNAKAIRVPGLSVERVQAALQEAGFNPGSIDGRFGAKTADAVKRFQRKNGLQADGIVGQKTWSVLKRESGSVGY